MEVVAGELFTELAKTAVGSAVPSLMQLIMYECGLNQCVKDGLANLEAELVSMQTFVESVSSIPPDQRDQQVNNRCSEVSNLMCDIEKNLHCFMVNIQRSSDSFGHTLRTHVINHDIDKYIKAAMVDILSMRGRHGPYPTRNSLLKSIPTDKVNPHILAMYTSEPNPEGIEGPVEDVKKMLSSGHHVSIVGMVGLGKTTLARAVYDQMNQDFEGSAFVLVGKRAKNNVLKDILHGLGIEIPGDASQPEQLIQELQKFAATMRCLLVIDDIRDDGTWELFESVFEHSEGSRIISTSHNHKVNTEVGGVYPMKPLSLHLSKKLLRIKAKVHIHDTDFDELSDKIVRKCGGVPIAINAIGSFLAKNKSKGWYTAYRSIGFDEHKKDGTFENIKKALSCSYYDLPYHIKKCFLYLNQFPEDHWIEKNMLIWRWVAEGLVSESVEQTQGLFELGETYFNELIDRCMLQWAVSPRDIGQGGCRVHSLMFELIRDLSIPSSQTPSFSTVLGTKQESTSKTSTIQRLAIHKTSLDELQTTSAGLTKTNPNTDLEVGEVLSFYASMCPGSILPPLSRFARLRVIDLEDCDLSVGDCKLEDLKKLKYMEYLGLSGTHIANLPKQIRKLSLLQILDVTGTGIKELPDFVEKLKRLRCLRAGKGTTMNGRVEELTSLEELWLHSADKSPGFAAELKKLTKLRVLVVHFDEMNEGMQEELVKSLHELKKIEVLQVWSDAEEKVRLPCWDWEESVPSKELRQLLLFGIIIGRPPMKPWNFYECVPKLSKLLLEVKTLEAEDLVNLGMLPSLLSLYLHSEDSEDNELSYTAGKDEFKVLEYLYINIELVCGHEGLPRIQELEVARIKVGTKVGLLKNHMPLLERATYHLDCRGHREWNVQRAEAALVQASTDHPNHPALSIKRFNNAELEMTRIMRESSRSYVAASDADGFDVKQWLRNLDSTAFLDEFQERLGAIVASPTLAVVDPGNGSQSQFAGHEGEVMFTSGSTILPFFEDSTSIRTHGTESQWDAELDYVTSRSGLDIVALNKVFERFTANPKVAACLDATDNATGIIPFSEFSRLAKECWPILIDEMVQGIGEITGTVPTALQAVDAAFPIGTPIDGPSLFAKNIDRPSSTPCYAGDGQTNASNMPLVLPSDPALANQIVDLPAQLGFQDAVENTTSVAQCVGPAMKSGQDDGENISRIVKELLPPLEQALAAGASSGQPSSTQPDNVGISEHGAE